MSFDPKKFKQQFPLFAQAENHSLIYLDNAATTQKPQCVIDAISHFYIHSNGNAQRSSHRLARQATAVIERAREQTAKFLGAKKKENMVFTRGATEGINMIAYGLRHKLTEHDNIIVSYAEHHANLLPWQEAGQATGCSLTLVSPDLNELNDEKNLNLASVKIIALTLASNALGTKTDINQLQNIRKNYPGSIIVLDITQWIAHESINLSTLPCDFAVCSAHKFYGPTGLGILYGKTHYLEQLAPLTVGGEMVDTVSPQKSTYQKGFRALEAGTSSLAAIAGLGACIDFWNQQDRSAMNAHEKKLSYYLHEKLQTLCTKDPKIQLLTHAKNNIGIASITCTPPYSIADLALWLDEKNIAARAGEHCTQLLWKNHTPPIANGALRFSIAAYNTYTDIDNTIEAIESYCKLIDSSGSKKEADLFKNMDWQELVNATSWQQRYKQLIFWGKSLPPQTDIRKEKYLIKGCESSVWIKHSKEQDKYYFIVDSDSNVIKGLAALILCRANGKTTEAIHSIDFEEYFTSIGLKKHLSHSRVNGFYALYQSILAKTISSSD